MTHETRGNPDDARDPGPLPLGYGPRDPSARTWKVFLALTGAVSSVVVVGFFAAIFFPYPLFEAPRPQTVKPVWWAVAMFFATAIGGIIGTALLFTRRPLKRVGWFFIGVLIGLGLIGLLEGMCYANP